MITQHPDPLKLHYEKLEAYFIQYDIGQLIEFNFIRTGLNYSYLIISTSGKYILRIYRKQWRNIEDICYEIDALIHISKNHANISVPIASLTGEYISEIYCCNEIYNGVLFSYAEGEIPKVDEESSFALGQLLANIHRYSDGFYSQHQRSYNIDLYHLVKEPMNSLSGIIKSYLSQENCDFISRLASYIKDELEDMDLEVGFCHGDLHDWNVHSHNGSYTIFDFDCCGKGFRAYDISVFWWNLKLNYAEKETQCWNAFIKGYESIRKILDMDRMSLQLFVMARRYWLAGTLIKNPDVFGTKWINEAGLTMFFNQLKDDVRNFNITF